MNGSSFIFDNVQLLYYKWNKKNPNCGGSYIDVPDWIKDKKATITLIIKMIINISNIVQNFH